MDIFGGDFDNYTGVLKGHLSTALENIPNGTQLAKKIESTADSVFKLMNQSKKFMCVKKMIDDNKTISDIRKVCQQMSESWANEFSNGINQICPAGNIGDSDMLSKHLTACFDKEYFKLFGTQMLMTTLCSFVQSVLAWKMVYNFHQQTKGTEKVTHDTNIEIIRKKLGECTRILAEQIGLKQSISSQVKDLKRVQEILSDAKDMIEFVINNLKSKIEEAKRLKDNSYWSAVMNAIKFLVTGYVSYQMVEKTGFESKASLSTLAATLIHGGITIGDVIAANKVGECVLLLEEYLKEIQLYNDECKRLSAQTKERSDDIFIGGFESVAALKQFNQTTEETNSNETLAM